MTLINMTGTSYVHNDWLSSFAAKRAANRFSVHLMPCSCGDPEHFVKTGGAGENSYFKNMSGIIMHVIAVASAIFAAVNFLFLSLLSAPFALAITAPGLLIGAACISSDIREYKNPPSPILTYEEVRNFFLHHEVFSL